MRIGIYASIIASDRGFENNVSGHIQIPAQTVRVLREQGHEVHLISNRFGPEKTLPTCIPEDVQLHLVDDGRVRPKLLRGGKPTQGIRPLKLLKQIRQIKRVIHGQKLDVLHVFGYHRSAMLGGLVKAMGLRKPVVVTLVGGNLPAQLSMPAKMLFGRVAKFVSATDYAAGNARRLGLDVQVIRHGIVRDLVAEVGDTPTEPRHRVLYWRDPTKLNGADLCYEAFDRLAPEFPEVSFDMAIRRNFDEIPGLDELDARHENVHIYRFPYEEGMSLPKLIAESLLVVLPFRLLSMDPQFSIAETVAAGVPMITSDLGSNKEIVEHGRGGLIVPVGETQPVVDGIRSLLQDREALRIMGENAARDFHARWNWDGYGEQLTAMYRSLTQGSPSP